MKERPLNLETAEKILRQLVLIPTSTQPGKKEIIDFVRNYLEKIGFKCEISGKQDSPALIASIDSPKIILSGHLDTVPIGKGWTVEQGETRNAILYGRGATDMKGGCTAMLMAAEVLQRNGVPVALAFTTDEETGMLGAEQIADSEIVSNAWAIVVCEPSALSIGVKEKGLLQLRITTVGKASHASMPEEGDNAIHKMLPVIDRIRGLIQGSNNEKDKLLLNLTLIQGGEKVNVIPDHCKLEIDIRTPEDMEIDTTLAMIEERIGDIDCNIDVINRLKATKTPENAEIIKLISEIDPKIVIGDIAFASELVRYLEKNKNSVVFGPGEHKQAHSIDEHIDLNEVVEAARIYCELCKRIHDRTRG